MPTDKFDEVDIKPIVIGSALLTATTDTPSENAINSEIKVTLMSNEDPFYEILRRIPKSNLVIIEATLERVTPEHIAFLHAAMSNQESLLANTSFIHHDIFPFAALKAVCMGEISPLQFGSLMALWGNLETILPNPSEPGSQATPEFVPLFTVEGEKNLRASTLLLLCLQPSSTLPNLVVKTPEEILSEIYEKAIYLPRSEQGFWVVEDSTPKSDVVQTIAQTIKLLDVKFLAFNADDKREMIPSFGLQQVFLDVAFPHAVRINPVIGASTPIDIRKGSLERYRDIALPFPGNELPKVADNFPAPSALDFMFHDRYHSVRASRVIPHETELYLVIGDKLNVMQNRYNVAVKEFNKLHDEHIRLLPTFGSVIEKLPLDKRCGVTEQVRKKFNQEVAIINKLKKMRKSIGQLKFRLWDMERTFSGSSIDKPGVCAFEELQRIVASIEVDLGVLGKIDGTVELSKYSGHRVADAVLDAVKPEVVDLKSLQNLIRTGREALRGLPFFFMPAQPPGQRAYDDAILDAPVSLSQSSTSS